jgi:hypothetical protein
LSELGRSHDFAIAVVHQRVRKWAGIHDCRSSSFTNTL